MKRKIILVYVSDTQIYGVLAKEDVNGAFIKIAENTQFYSGILDSRFNDNEDFANSFETVVSGLCSKYHGEIPAVLYVGVPHTCCRIKCEERDIELGKSVRLNTKHTNAIKDSINLEFDAGVTLLAREVVYYSASEYKMYTDIRGATADTVTMFYTIIGAVNEFLSAVPVGAVAKYGIRDVKFIPLPSADAFLVPEIVRDGGCTMIRNDFFTTSIVHILGDSATYISTYNVGIGRIIDEIMESFSISYEMAMKLLKQSTVTANAGADDNYIINRRSFPSQIVNKLVRKQLLNIGKELCKEDMAVIVYFSGERIDEIFGAVNIISNEIGAHIEMAADNLTKENRYPDTTINALLRYIVR
jgi:cell division ATPase FtsA